MFILKSIGSRRRLFEEETPGEAAADAKDDKPACEVRISTTLVLLHQAAVKNVGADVLIGNTLVSDKGNFAGCGKHCIVLVSNANKQVQHDEAVEYMKKYAAVMFGKDIAASIESSDVVTQTENGDLLTQDQLEKLAKAAADAAEKKGPVQKDKPEAKKGGSVASAAGDEIDVDEAVPSFMRFLSEEGEPAGEPSNAQGTGEVNGAQGTGEVNGAQGTGEVSDAQGVGEVTVKPVAHYLTYTISAQGQPEKDHTERKEVMQTIKALGGKIKVPDEEHAWGIKFSSTLGGGSDDLNLKKALKDFRGIVNPEELQTNVTRLFNRIFHNLTPPKVDIRDRLTLDEELSQIQKDHQFLEGYDYNSNAQARVRSANFSVWIEVSDQKQKPYVKPKDIANILNAALKKMGGRYLRGKQSMSEGVGKAAKKAYRMAKNTLLPNIFKGGITQDKVIFLRTASATKHGGKSRRDLLDNIPDRGALLSCIYSQGDRTKGINKNSTTVWNAIESRLKKLRDQAQNDGDDTAGAAYKIWNDFRKAHEGKPDGLTLADYEEFLRDYTQFYEKYVGRYLTEADQTRISLMREMFGDLYEAEEKEEGEDDSPDDGDDGGDGNAESRKKAEEMANSIFIVPMPKLDMPGSDDKYSYY